MLTCTYEKEYARKREVRPEIAYELQHGDPSRTSLRDVREETSETPGTPTYDVKVFSKFPLMRIQKREMVILNSIQLIGAVSETY